MILLLWLACGGSPFENDPPKLLSVNGAKVNQLFNFVMVDESNAMDFFAEPGTDYAITLEIEEPERQGVRVWWPYQPPGFAFDPDATSGVWHVPAEGYVQEYGLKVILQDDDRRDPQMKAYDIPVYTWSDTGIPDSGGF